MITPAFPRLKHDVRLGEYIEVSGIIGHRTYSRIRVESRCALPLETSLRVRCHA